MPEKKAVEAATLELIKNLQSKDYLKDFYLAGGTALALYLNHRRSDDIDLFSNFGFDAAGLLENMSQDFTYNLFFTASSTLKGEISGINVDIIAHRYKYIEKQIDIQGVSVLSEPDIIAMKLNAIATSGQRSKDFIDVYYLLDKFNISRMLDFYKTKYEQKNDQVILKSLIYFDDVDLSDWPVMIQDTNLKWADVKKRINSAVLDFARRK